METRKSQCVELSNNFLPSIFKVQSGKFEIQLKISRDDLGIRIVGTNILTLKHADYIRKT